MFEKIKLKVFMHRKWHLTEDNQSLYSQASYSRLEMKTNK